MSDIDDNSNVPLDGAEEPALSPAASVLAARLTIGALLAETRAAAGRELAEVAREIRVPLRHLMAIEADDHQRLPALPYALGFVKSYARSLGLNPEAAAAQFRAETSITPHVPTPINLEPLADARLPSRQLAWGSLALLVLLIGGLGLYGAGVFDPAPVAVPVDVVADAAPDALPADPAPVLPPPAAMAAPDPAALPAATPPGLPGAPAVAAAPVAGPSAGPAVGSVVSPATGRAIPTSGPVVLVAQEDVWVKIYDRATGRRAFMGMLSAGQRFAVPADGPPLTLRSGRAGVVQVQVAGVALPPLGGPVSTIDGVVLTAPALAARFAPPPAEPAAAAPAPPATATAALRRAVQPPASQARAQMQQTGSPNGD